MLGYDYDLINVVLILVLVIGGLFGIYSWMSEKLKKEAMLEALMGSSAGFASEVNTRRGNGKRITNILHVRDLVESHFRNERVDLADAVNSELNIRRQLKREKDFNKDSADELKKLRDLAKEMKTLIRDLQRDNVPSSQQVKVLEGKLLATEAAYTKTHEAHMAMINK